MPIRSHPAGPARLQSPGGGLDEGHAKGPVFPTTVMEGGIHEHEVEVRLAASGTTKITLPEQGPGIAHIAPGAGDGAAINVPKLKARHPWALQGSHREDAEAAPKVGATSLEGREDLQQQGCTGVRPVPAEDARLGPETQARLEADRAGVEGRLQSHRNSGAQGPADPVLAARLIRHLASKATESFSDPGAPAVPGRQGDDLRARRQDLDRARQHPVPLETSWRGQDEGGGEGDTGRLGEVRP